MRIRQTVKMKDVAEMAGVSLMTVSLVLPDDAASERISPNTSSLVRSVVKELGYKPNARAQALRSGYTNILGLYSGYAVVKVRQPFYVELLSGLQNGCEQFRKDLLVQSVFHADVSKDSFTELVDGRIDGLVVNIPPDDPLVERFVESGFPVMGVAPSMAYTILSSCAGAVDDRSPTGRVFSRSPASDTRRGVVARGKS